MRIRLLFVSFLVGLLTTMSGPCVRLVHANTAPSPEDTVAIEALVAPIALYPDELLAIVLPAAAHPLQVVQAARFLDARAADPALVPDDHWDPSVVALLNYPEALSLLNKDLDWTARLGTAVTEYHSAVLEAIERYRERAYIAGNLASDDRKRVAQTDNGIEIHSVVEDQTFVPYYEPAAMIYPQTSVAYHYYPRHYPVYYYPYAHGYRFQSPFWGLSSAYAIDWYRHRLHFYPHDHRAHPYRGHRYHRRHDYHDGHRYRHGRRAARFRHHRDRHQALYPHHDSSIFERRHHSARRHGIHREARREPRSHDRIERRQERRRHGQDRHVSARQDRRDHRAGTQVSPNRQAQTHGGQRRAGGAPRANRSYPGAITAYTNGIRARGAR